MGVDAVILAAGYSSRADGYKMEFLIKDKPMLQHVIEAFLPICNHVFVVGGYQWERLLPLLKPYGKKVQLIINEDFEKGMFSSVKKGVQAVTAKQFFITPGDYPLITTDICLQILSVGKDFVIPSFHQKAGHPILLNSHCIPEILEEEIQSNLNIFLKRKEKEYVNITDEGILLDLDTQEDYKNLQIKSKGKKNS